ncbi:Predicted oxidoreductase [Parasphingorhabdus marina DSM 22363]|uniref:Predicted oxidoreductase n=1 Tax=Parasphingorhabdus marina DSM 22363 TaxID=1123272 RepID=A0A1N6CMK6_9SPHN|nr:aldo/keto reductase [Parasphingorhabdus marina]SIN59838.1 Predicted oxidoreductase [Parasphingorhabdus marina DSM 22363]
MSDTINRTFTLEGQTRVSRMGYGAMRLTGQPGNFGPFEDWEAGISLLRRASELGVDLFDSAHAYGPQTADQIVGEALGGRKAILATKGGVSKSAPDRILVDGSRDTLHSQIDQALANLRRDRIDLFQLHRVDPDIAIEESVAALAEAQADGRIRHIGLSNVTRKQLDRALAVAPIASVQNRYNMAEAGEDDLVDYTAARGIAFIPYGPLGANPMQKGAGLDPQDALAWLLKRSPNIIVIPGTTRIAHLEENIAVWGQL